MYNKSIEVNPMCTRGWHGVLLVSRVLQALFLWGAIVLFGIHYSRRWQGVC